MRNFPLAAVLLLLVSVPTLAQTESTNSSYRVDNFDFANGVRIEMPAPPQVRKSRKGRMLAAGSSEGALAPARVLNMNASGALSGFTTGNPTVDSYIIESGQRNSVDPLLLYAIMHQESTFKARAMSNKGARGLMQLMPGTARQFAVENPYEARANIDGGTRYLKTLLERFELPLALAAYNAGEAAVRRFGGIPPYPETQAYVKSVLRAFVR